MNKKIKIVIVASVIIILGVALDQISKVIFENLYNQGKLPAYLFGPVGFQWRINYGGAWSVLADSQYKNLVFFLLTIIGIPLFGVLLFIGRQKSWFGIIGYSGIISGAIGNAIDRGVRGDEFFSGGVRDFISVGNWFPTFNIADMLLVGGTICVFLALLFLDGDALFRGLLTKNKNARQTQDGIDVSQQDEQRTSDAQGQKALEDKTQQDTKDNQVP